MGLLLLTQIQQGLASRVGPNPSLSATKERRVASALIDGDCNTPFLFCPCVVPVLSLRCPGTLTLLWRDDGQSGTEIALELSQHMTIKAVAAHLGIS